MSIFEKLSINLLKDVFKREYDKSVSFLSKRKLFVAISLLIILCLYLDYKFLQFSATLFLTDFFLDNLRKIPQWSYNLIFSIWLFIISFVLFKSNKQVWMTKGDFSDNFRKGLRSSEWEWYGDWRIEEEDNRNVLCVTRSERGGFTRVGTHWDNYILRFDTKIINDCSGWLVRVKDKHNYLMFQCGTDSIIPHIRINSFWEVGTPILLSSHLQLNNWYSVIIKVKGNIVEMQISGNSIRYTIPPTTTPNRPTIYSDGQRAATFDTDLIIGRIGFRQSGGEKALFRDIRVKAIN